MSFTVAAGGTHVANMSGCSVFGLDGMPTPPSHGTVADVNPASGNASGIATYVNNHDGALSDSFVVLDDENGTITFTVTVSPAITLSPSALPNPAIGNAYSASVTASGGVAPYAYAITAGALAAGLTLSSSGALSGTPTAGGTFSFTVTATDSVAATGTRAYSVTIGAATIVITPSTLPAATVAAAYSQAVTASGGTTPYTYAVTAGATPAGLTLSSSGTLSGTPSAAGPYNFTVTATDSSTGTGPYTGSRVYSGTVNPQLPVAGAVSATVAYDSSSNPITLNLSGGAPTSVAVASGASHGTAIASGTSITYTPTTGFFGTDSFTYTATNGSGTSSPATVSITVVPPTISVTPTTLAAGTFGTAYSHGLSASGGQGPYSFSSTLASGALPAGLALAGSGAITGTPTASGTFTFTVTGTDSSTPVPASFTSATISLTINAAAPGAPAIGIATAGDAQATVAFSAPTSNGGSAITGYTAISNPAGGVDSNSGTTSTSHVVTGLTNGTPYTFTVTATNASGTSAPSAASNSVTPSAPPAAPVFANAVSRRVHGSAGTFDLPLSAVTTDPTTEPRMGPAQTIVLTFDKAVTGATATITEGSATAGVSTFSGNDVIVALTGVGDQQYVTVSLTNVTSADGGTGGSGAVRIGLLLGDVDQNRVVSLADLAVVNAQLAQIVTVTNFLKDVNASGTLSLADKAITNANLTHSLPAP